MKRNGWRNMWLMLAVASIVTGMASGTSAASSKADTARNAQAVDGAPHPQVGVESVPNFQMPFPCNQTWYGSSYYAPDQDAPHGAGGLAIDFHATSHGSTPAGLPVVASHGGVVDIRNGSGVGYHVVVRDGAYATLYGHLQNGSGGALDGQTVAQGQQIGLTGSTGANNVHLHYEQWNGDWQGRSQVFNGSAVAYPLPGYSAGRGMVSQNCGAPPPPDTDGDGVSDPNDQCPNLTGSPGSFGCPQGSSIGAARNGDGRLEIFGTNDSGVVFHRWQTRPGGGWSSPWATLPGELTSIAAETNANGRIEAFGVNSTGVVFHNRQRADGTWSPWKQIPGLLHSIAVARNADGRLELFGTNESGVVFHRWQTRPGGGWSSPWATLPGQLTQVAAELNARGRIEVFGINSSGLVFRSKQRADFSWAPWTQIDGSLRP